MSGPSFVPEGKNRIAKTFSYINEVPNYSDKLGEIAFGKLSRETMVNYGRRLLISGTPDGSILVLVDLSSGWFEVPVADIVKTCKIRGS